MSDESKPMEFYIECPAWPTPLYSFTKLGEIQVKVKGTVQVTGPNPEPLVYGPIFPVFGRTVSVETTLDVIRDVLEANEPDSPIIVEGPK